MKNAYKTAVIVPTFNPGNERWKLWLAAFSQQTLKPDQVLIIDSGSSDQTVANSIKHGYETIGISASEFNHGGTRDSALKKLNKEIDIVIFLTQDAVLASKESLKKIVDAFIDSNVSASYGRQLPSHDATQFAAHARYYNYPAESQTKTIKLIPEIGIKAAFISNSFAAYRKERYLEHGGFPSNTILCEDMYLAAKIILSNENVAYTAEATVFHSHNYSPQEEFKRYFDIGVFHSREPWIQAKLGGNGNEGLKFIKSEFKYIYRNNKALLILIPVYAFAKILGYKLGKLEHWLPTSFKRKVSMHFRFWNDDER